MRQLIFVIDGEIEVCQQARLCLEEAGYAVRCFSSGEVMAEAEESRPALLLISLMLPGGSGLTLSARSCSSSVVSPIAETTTTTP